MDPKTGGNINNPPPGFNPSYQAQRPSWFSRNKMWFLPLLLVGLISPFACCGGCYYFGKGLLMAPRDGVVDFVNNDARVTDKLGTPITAGSKFSMSDMQNNNGNGTATMSFDIEGTDGRTADVEGAIKGVGGVWTPEDMTVTFSDGSTVHLPE